MANKPTMTIRYTLFSCGFREVRGEAQHAVWLDLAGILCIVTSGSFCRSYSHSGLNSKQSLLCWPDLQCSHTVKGRLYGFHCVGSTPAHGMWKEAEKHSIAKGKCYWGTYRISLSDEILGDLFRFALLYVLSNSMFFGFTWEKVLRMRTSENTTMINFPTSE